MSATAEQNLSIAEIACAAQTEHAAMVELLMSAITMFEQEGSGRVNFPALRQGDDSQASCIGSDARRGGRGPDGRCRFRARGRRPEVPRRADGVLERDHAYRRRAGWRVVMAAAIDTKRLAADCCREAATAIRPLAERIDDDRYSRWFGQLAEILEAEDAALRATLPAPTLRLVRS
jgi:hypothetical protein